MSFKVYFLKHLKEKTVNREIRSPQKKLFWFSCNMKSHPAAAESDSQLRAHP